MDTLTLILETKKFKYKTYKNVRCRRFVLSWDNTALAQLLEIPFRGCLDGTTEPLDLIARKWKFANTMTTSHKVLATYYVRAETILNEVSLPLNWRTSPKLGSFILVER